MKPELRLEFEEDKDGSGDGTLTMYIDGFVFCCVPISHSGQKEIMYRVVGTYQKVKAK